MTKWDRLLVQLDKVFGFEDRKQINREEETTGIRREDG